MILLVNQFITPIFLDIANAFAKAGEPTTVITGSIDAGGSSLDPGIRVVTSVRYNRYSVSSRFITWILFSIHLFFHVLFRKKPASILVATNPPIAPIVIYYVSRWRNIPYHILLYDLYPEALQQAGFASHEGFIYRRWKKINNKVFQKASTIFTLSASMKEAASVYVKNDSVKVISNWVDTSYIKPVDKSDNPFIQKHSLQGKTVVLYSGNMGYTHDLESVIEAAYALRSWEHLQFILIGEGGKRKLLEELAVKKQLSNVLFLPYQSSEDFPMAMAAADIGVITLGRGAEGISVPSKTYVNMAAGLCLLTIAPKNSELIRIVNEYQLGPVSEPGDSDGVISNLKNLLSHPEEMNAFKLNSLSAVRHFTPANAMTYVHTITADQNKGIA